MLLGRVMFTSSLLLSLATGCGGSSEPAAAPVTGVGEGTAGSATGGKALAAQIDEGGSVYKDHCASCHGTKGEGDSAPAVVGVKALPLAPPAGARTRKGEFKSAADVEAFVKSAMPIDAPGTLSDAQAFAVVAWELHESGTELGGVALDPSNAAQIHVH
jgi:cytochrome c